VLCRLWRNARVAQYCAVLKAQLDWKRFRMRRGGAPAKQFTATDGLPAVRRMSVSEGRKAGKRAHEKEQKKGCRKYDSHNVRSAIIRSARKFHARKT